MLPSVTISYPATAIRPVSPQQTISSSAVTEMGGIQGLLKRMFEQRRQAIQKGWLF